ARAAQLCRDCIFLPVDFTAYRHYSRLFKAALATIEPAIEDRGIDEVYVDLTANADDSETIGRQIKAAIRDATALTCSVGIAPNKLLAKIASDLDKPDGLTVVGDGDLERRIWPLPASRINGIGPKAFVRLQAIGIETIGDLAATPPTRLQKHFGPHYGQWLIDAAHGRDQRPVITESEPRSRSRETTFERDLHLTDDLAQIRTLTARMAVQVAADLAKSGHRARTIGIKLRYDDFSRVTRDLSLSRATGDAATIEAAALACLERIRRDRRHRRIRLFGVKASNLVAGADLADERITPQLF
ncbi:MAG: DNA polymerase IV, partial [Lautropia sp.]